MKTNEIDAASSPVPSVDVRGDGNRLPQPTALGAERAPVTWGDSGPPPGHFGDEYAPGPEPTTASPAGDGFKAGLPRRVAGAAEQEVERLRAALADLVSWFDGGPSAYGPWIIRAGDRGADAAVEAARVALEGKSNG